MSSINYFKNARDFVVFQPQETIFEAGQEGVLMYFVQEGEVDLYYKGHVLETLHAGDIFGEMALVDNHPRSATAVARAESKLIEVNRDRFLFLVQETPTFALQVMHTMAERIRKMNEVV